MGTFVGVFGDKPTVDMGTVQDRELRLIGTLMYQEADWRKAYEHIEAHRERSMKVMIVVET